VVARRCVLGKDT